MSQTYWLGSDCGEGTVVDQQNTSVQGQAQWPSEAGEIDRCAPCESSLQRVVTHTAEFPEDETEDFGCDGSPPVGPLEIVSATQKNWIVENGCFFSSISIRVDQQLGSPVAEELIDEFTTEQLKDRVEFLLRPWSIVPAVTAEIAAGAVVGVAISSRGSFEVVPTLAAFGGSPTGAASFSPRYRIKSLRILCSGFGYDSAPDVTVTGGGGSGASIEAIISDGQVTGFTIGDQGSGFTGPPAITIDTSGSGNSRARAVAVMELATIEIVSPGSGYQAAPSLRFTPAVGTANAAYSLSEDEELAVMTRARYTFRHPAFLHGRYRIDWIERFIPSEGVELSSLLVGTAAKNLLLLTVTPSGGGGAGGRLSARIAGESIAEIIVANGGSGFTAAPTLTIPAPRSGGTQATATARMGLKSAVVTSGGGGYTFPPTVVFSGGGGSGAQGFAEIQSGQITSIVITATGSGYTSAPTISFVGDGVGGAASARMLIRSVVISEPGTRYDCALTISGGDGEDGAGSLTVDDDPESPTWGQITAAELTNAGTGYNATPTVSVVSPAALNGHGWKVFARLGEETERVYEWDGDVPEHYTPGVDASWPETDLYELDEPETSGTLSVEAVRGSCE